MIPNVLQIEWVTDAATERRFRSKSPYDLFKKRSWSLWSKSLKKYRTESYFPTYIRLSMAAAECNQEFWRTQLGSLKFWV